MKIRLLFFSQLRSITGVEELDYSPPGDSDSIRVKDLLEDLFSRYEGLSDWNDKLLIAVNCEYSTREAKIRSGDEVAIMPPVQGG